jgi:hypothetical protein
MGCRFGLQFRAQYACSKVPLAAQSRSAGLCMPRGGKRVSEAVAASRHCHPRGHHGPANIFLNDRAIELVATLLPTASPNPAALSLACRPLPGVITTGTRRFTLARTTRTAPATKAAAGSGDGPSPPQRGSARHPESHCAAPPGCLPPCAWSCRRRCISMREPALTHSLHKLLQFQHRIPNPHG